MNTRTAIWCRRPYCRAYRGFVSDSTICLWWAMSSRVSTASVLPDRNFSWKNTKPTVWKTVYVRESIFTKTSEAEPECSKASIRSFTGSWERIWERWNTMQMRHCIRVLFLKKSRREHRKNRRARYLWRRPAQTVWMRRCRNRVIRSWKHG